MASFWMKLSAASHQLPVANYSHPQTSAKSKHNKIFARVSQPLLSKGGSRGIVFKKHRKF